MKPIEKGYQQLRLKAIEKCYLIALDHFKDDAMARDWFHLENSKLGCKPIDLINKGKEGALLEFMEAFLR
jgi:uncharacterized protein (DUF2384 family)